MIIRPIQRLFISHGNVTLAKSLKIRILYTFLIYGFQSFEVFHSLSTEYINIWYAVISLDTRYTRG